MSLHPLALVAVAATLAAGCGASSAKQSSVPTPLAAAATTAPATTVATAAPAPPVIDLVATDTGYSMPTKMPGGVVALHFRNDGAHPHEFAFGRLDPGHTAEEFMALPRDQQGDVPWVHDEAGPPLMTPGAEITITRRLEPGSYFFFDGFPSSTGEPYAKLGLVATIAAIGDSGAPLPKPDAVITASKDSFDVPTLRAGPQTIELRNASGAGRGFELTSINPGKTRADADRWFGQLESTGKSPDAPAPVTFLGAIQTIPTGTSVFLTVELEHGREYHLSDGESGVEANFTPA